MAMVDDLVLDCLNQATKVGMALEKLVVD